MLRNKRKTVVGLLLALVLMVGASAAVAVTVADDQPSGPPEPTKDYPAPVKADARDICEQAADKDKAIAEMCETGYMPVAAPEGEGSPADQAAPPNGDGRAGVVSWADLTGDRRAPIAIYDKPPAEGGRQIGTMPLSPEVQP